ncbi:MAG: GspE/PulE family protein [Campylobacterota bacterium]|nr:GspE/PulE family protein [Campylobacterota bacterium]
MQSLEDILLKNNNCTQSDIDQAYSIQKEYGGMLGNILLNLGAISDKVLIETLSIQYDFELFVNLSLEKIEKINIDNLSISFFYENEIFPIYQTENYIALATHNPLKSSILSTIKTISAKEVKIYLATEEELREIKSIYENIEDDEDSYDDFEDEVDKLKELASEAPVIKLVNNIFTKAVERYVSDIHFESYKLGMKVRYRLDGILQTVDTIPQKLKQAVTARLKLISKMNISENRLPQDGRITIKISGQDIDIRSSSVPTAFGESFVLRLLGNDSIDLSLDNMGFHKDNLNLLKDMLKKPNGIILTTGPTGSGKTSTLYAALNYIHSDDIKIITVEDPVEYQLEGISQIQVKQSIDYTFSNALRSILRQDPDVIMIGEIRDRETAQIAIQSALTGHLVLSTLHTNSAVGAISRLLDMDMEYFLLKSSIVGLMAQRLTRKLCNSCKESTNISDEETQLYNINNLKNHIESPFNPCKAVGCKQCNFTGYKGRMPILEIVPFDKKLMDKIDEKADFSDIRSLGYRTLQDDAILKFLEGHISLDEVRRLT